MSTTISRGRRRRDQRGQGSLESLGIFILAAILVTATVGVLVQTSPVIGDTVKYELCKILQVAGGGSCEKPGAPRTAEDRIPDEPCVVDSQGDDIEAKASAVVTVKRGYSFLIEHMSDGTYRVTRVNSAGVGVGTGIGFDASVTVDGQKYGVTATAGAEALLSGKQGQTWYADNAGDANDVIENIIANDVVDEITPTPSLFGWTPPNPVRAAIKALIDDPGDPDEEFVEGGLEGDAGASLSGITAGAGGDVSADAYLGGKKTPDGYVAYFKASVDAGVYANVTGLDNDNNVDHHEANAGGKAEVLEEVEFDEDGHPKGIKVTTGYSLDASADAGNDHQKYTETELEVPLTGDPAHDAPLYAALTGDPTALLNFAKQARNDGYVTQNVYDEDPGKYGLDFDVEALLEVGLSLTGDDTTRTLQDSTYWDGTQMADRPGC